ncbi:MAG: CvpA family protein, partial [Oscillospiraceae bacterium]|nr:CvpA family protein [Oscillospiraceae bacterium]
MISLVYDIVIVLIFIFCIWRGYKKGVLRTVLGLVCIVLSYLIASAVSSYPICSGIYEKYLRETVYERIDTSVQNAKEETAKKIKQQAEDAADDFIDKNFRGSPEAKDFADRIFEEGSRFIEEAIPQVGPEIYGFFDNHKETLLTNPEISGKIESVADFYSKKAAVEINERLPLGITVKEETLKDLITNGDAADAFMYELFGADTADAANAANTEDGGRKGVAEYIERQAAAPVFIRLIGVIL